MLTALPALLIDRTDSSNRTVLFRLVSTMDNRAAIGARVKVASGRSGAVSRSARRSQSLSQNDLRLLFGTLAMRGGGLGDSCLAEREDGNLSAA